MRTKKSEPSSTNELMTFNFSESQNQVRSITMDNVPWLIAKDICDILEIANSRDAIDKLDSDEKLMSVIPTSGQNRKMWLVNESGMYALIMRSNKPQAKVFRKWVTSEVLPAIRKKGSYRAFPPTISDYLDMRDVPFRKSLYLGAVVKSVEVNGEPYYDLNDFSRAIKLRSGSHDRAKSVNRREKIAIKIWIYMASQPTWFAPKKGLDMIICSCRNLATIDQLDLSFNTTLIQS